MIVAVKFTLWGSGRESNRTCVTKGEKPVAHYPHYARQTRKRLDQHVRISLFVTDRAEVGLAH
jgi:hypothetical protein